MRESLFKGQKYKIVLADPAWWFAARKTDGNTKFGGGVHSHYKTMKEDELRLMRHWIDNITDKDCALFMWATGSELDQAIRVLEAWNFRYATTAFVWVKVTKDSEIVAERHIQNAHLETDFVDENQFTEIKDATTLVLPGNYTGSNIEYVLLGVKGSMCPHIIQKLVPQIIFAPKGKHSAKPDEVGERIVRMFGDLPRIELFARKYTDGWDATGLELDGTDYMELINPYKVEEWVKTHL